MVSRSSRTAVLAWGLMPIIGCFESPPSTADDGTDPTATGTEPGSDSSGATTVVSLSASSPTVADHSGSASETGDDCGNGDVDEGEICDDGNEIPGDGCEPGCTPSVAAEHWTVIEDGDGLDDAAFAVVVDAEGMVTVAGAQHVEANDGNPWVARYDAAGVPQWSDTTDVGSGNDLYRGLAVTDGGGVVGVGSYHSGQLRAWIHAHGADGSPGWDHTFSLGEEDASFVGLTVRDDGGLVAVGSIADGPGFTPLVASYDYAGPDWSEGQSSANTGSFVGTVGELFAVAALGDGTFVAVGYVAAMTDAGSDAMAVWFDLDGTVISQASFGGADDDDFVDVAVVGDVVHAVGRRGGGEGISEVWLVRLSIEANITIAWEGAWSDQAFNVANALAVRDDARFIVGSTNTALDAEGFDARVLRWDGDADAPTWVAPFADDSPGLDYANDVALAPDGTIVVCGVVTPRGAEDTDAWIRKLEP
jgi:cysteine-rich repeat protein